MKNLKWRLHELPTGGEIADLVEQEVITKDEAREILFSTNKDDQEDVKSLKSEINFLRELVEKMASKGTTYVWPSTGYTKYVGYPWYQTYSQALGTTFTTTGTSTLGGGYTAAYNNVGAVGVSSGAIGSSALSLPKYAIK